MPRRLAQQCMTLSDLEWPFHASRAISVVSELLVAITSYYYLHGRRQELLEGVLLLCSPPLPFFMPFPLHFSLCRFPSLPSPSLRSRAPLNQLNELGGLGERCKLPQGYKQICCTLQLSESHWWQSF